MDCPDVKAGGRRRTDSFCIRQFRAFGGRVLRNLRLCGGSGGKQKRVCLFRRHRCGYHRAGAHTDGADRGGVKGHGCYCKNADERGGNCDVYSVRDGERRHHGAADQNGYRQKGAFRHRRAGRDRSGTAVYGIESKYSLLRLCGGNGRGGK